MKKLGKRTVTLVLLFSVGMMINKDDLLSDHIRAVLGRLFSSNDLTSSFAASLLEGTEVESDSKTNIADVKNSTYIWPVPDCKTVSQKYGLNHDGIEIACEGDNVRIVAVCDGIVKKVESSVCKHEDRIDDSCSDDGKGNYLILKHDNGLESRYEHLKYDSITVDVGDKVKAGDTIAYMGSSGRSIKQHLYFQLNDSSNKAINVNQDNIKYIYRYKSKQDGNPKQKWKVKVKSLNMRIKPSTNEAVIAMIPKNSILEIDEIKKVDNKKWLRTRYTGKIGWCYSECLTNISEKEDKSKKNSKTTSYKRPESAVVKYNIIAGKIDHKKLIYHKGDIVHRYVFDIPTRKGYNFDGWYMDPNYNTPVAEEFEINEDTTVYAKWTK